MSLHLQRQVDKLKKTILGVGAMVEEALDSALRAIATRDLDLAQRVIDGDDAIDQTEIEVEEECLHTLALHQPVAFDLRFVVAVLKINIDLERIGDLAVNLAQQAQFLARGPAMTELPYDLPGMAQIVRTMLKNSLDALVNIDPVMAQTVRQSDDQVDAIHRANYVQIEHRILADPTRIEQQIHMLNISRQLERIADHTVNIAEDVLYMSQGSILRHMRK